MMHPQFEVHLLNALGIEKAKGIAEHFDKFLTELESKYCGTADDSGNTRELAIVKTKLEEACFFAKKAMAKNKINQQ